MYVYRRVRCLRSRILGELFKLPPSSQSLNFWKEVYRINVGIDVRAKERARPNRNFASTSDPDFSPFEI